MTELWGTLAILVALAGLMAGVRALQAAGRIGPEVARKTVHVGMGLISFPLPWIFPDPRLIWIVAVVVAMLFAAIRLVPAMAKSMGGVLGGVSRVSLGEIYYPIGAALTFTLAHRTPFVFCSAMGGLAFGDTAGALVGSRWGRWRYAMPGGTKSVEGSGAVLVVSAACAGFSLVMADHETRTTALAGALFVGTSAAMIEALAGGGLDNLLLPVGVVGLINLWVARSGSTGLPVLCLVAWGFLFSVLVLGFNGASWFRAKKQPPGPAVP